MPDTRYDVTIRVAQQPDEDHPASWDWRTLLDSSLVEVIEVKMLKEEEMPTLTREQQDTLHDENDEFEREVDREVIDILRRAVDDALIVADDLYEGSHGWDDNHRKSQVVWAAARRIEKIIRDNGGEE
jgi:D-hexose-6-phosphate mutarotase